MKAFAFIAAMWCVLIDYPGMAIIVLVLILFGAFDD